MLNEYVIQAKDIKEELQVFSKDKFLTLLANAEKHFKRLLTTENLCCPRCGLIIGERFKLGVRISSNELNPAFIFFAAHSSCMDGRLYDDYRVTENNEIELSAPAFLQSEELVLSTYNVFHKALDMLETKLIHGA